MARIGEDVATHVAESSVDKAMQELKYLCCYKTYVDDFEEEKTSLSARRNTVLKDIEVAKHRNENQVEDEVALWLERANGLIGEDTKGKKKWFGLVTNCLWQYKRGKELEGKTQRIKQLLLEQSNFARVARSTGLPGMEFYSSPNFMTFEDRKSISEKLKEALKDDNKFMIGLYGLGGTGKTTMAIEVGKDVADSKLFDKVIFSVVSMDVSLKKIRGNIAKHLDFPLEGMDESEQAQELWKRIAEGGEKVLIILDDMWEKLTPQDIGIPLGRHGKGHCAVLLTTRDWSVCRDMGCHEIIELKVLNEEDAVNLFLSYAGMSIDGASNGSKDAARGIVKECGSLPVAIVAVASALKSRPLSEWQDSLKRLQNHEQIRDVKQDLKQAYNSLRLSYDNLKNEKAQKLFLLCSLFPEDYEIPIELLTRIAIGVGLCGEANKYSVARSHFTPIKNELIDSCLLLKAKNESLKMHDLVREVALWIGNKQVQAGMNSNSTIMENIQYSSWNIVDFPNHFDGKQLEVLLLWINDANSRRVKVPNAPFEGMENLKILALMSSSDLEISTASLFQSPFSLTNVRTLTIKNFKSLGDISILANLKNLESLELNNCSIIELPKEIKESQKLRLLEMVKCSLTGRNNPFEVIGSCFQLEELYYASNNVDDCRGQITTLPMLQRYYIGGQDYVRNYEEDSSISRYFDSRNLRVYFSNEIFKLLVARAEVLMLGRDYHNRGWTNIVPDILSVKYDNMKDQLTRLSLDSMNEIKCLIHIENLRPGVAIFSKLVELTLHSMDVRELCHGPYPVDFLKQLKELHLSRCEKLEGMLFDGKLELCNLKSMHLSKCSMTCLFHASTAQRLMQLETLEIGECLKLKYIVAETMDDQDPNQKSHDSMLPKLKYLRINCCAELEFILPICFCEDLPLLKSMKIGGCEKLKYVFGQYPDHRDLHQMGKGAILQLLEVLEIDGVPNFINIYAECYLPRPCFDEVQKSSPSAKVDASNNLSRGRLCCFWPKALLINLSRGRLCYPSTSMNTQSNHNQALKVNYVVNRAHGLFTPPLYPCRSLRRIRIFGFSELKSLFTPSIVSSLKLLEWLEVGNCDALEHIVTDEEHGHDRGNVNSIFPNLREVGFYGCSHLEYIFPAFYSKDFKHLESVEIAEAGMLTHVFGKCRADENLNVQKILG
ncbi:probable disease resistance protein At4g27220 [Neltuma alba]|uniref:probable disease resistance protein At4g27220 n=1 Tax=Neltuma alba TaxID=207710 RepID=UPI0010A530D9|nr:probable disease resistance protein At4g27220 [Prosopis alba]